MCQVLYCDVSIYCESYSAVTISPLIKYQNKLVDLLVTMKVGKFSPREKEVILHNYYIDWLLILTRKMCSAQEDNWSEM